MPVPVVGGRRLAVAAWTLAPRQRSRGGAACHLVRSGESPVRASGLSVCRRRRLPPLGPGTPSVCQKVICPKWPCMCTTDLVMDLIILLIIDRSSDHPSVPLYRTRSRSNSCLLAGHTISNLAPNSRRSASLLRAASTWRQVSSYSCLPVRKPHRPLGLRPYIERRGPVSCTRI